MRRLLVVFLTLLLVGLIAVPATASTPKGLEVRFAQSGTWSCGETEVSIVAPGHRVVWVDGDQYLATHLDYNFVSEGVDESWSYDFGGPKGEPFVCNGEIDEQGGLLTIEASAVKVPRR